MNKYISILRGINVGGNRKILMKDLISIYEEIGFKNVNTYIQSGNVIFESDEEINQIEITDRMQDQIKKLYDFDVPVIVIKQDELAKAILLNPYIESDRFDIDRLYMTFLKEIPDGEKVEKIKNCNFDPDKFEIIGQFIFLYYHGKSSDSKMTNSFFEKNLKVSATSRNWRTVMAICNL